MTISIRTLRSGAWSLQPGRARVSYRDGSGPSNRLEDLGFRCALIVWGHQ